MGSADPARSVHHGENHLLEVSENQRPDIQHHVEGLQEKEKGRKEGRKVRKLVDMQRRRVNSGWYKLWSPERRKVVFKILKINSAFKSDLMSCQWWKEKCSLSQLITRTLFTITIWGLLLQVCKEVDLMCSQRYYIHC